MRDDSNLLEPLLDEEDQSKSISVRRPSFSDKLWGIVPQSSAALCLSFKKGVGHGVPCFSHKSTMTEAVRPLVKRKMVILILHIFAFLAFLILLATVLYFFSNTFPWSRQLSKVDEIEARKNVMVALSDVPRNLTLGMLLAAEREEPCEGAMRDCLEKAAEEFSEEPRIVKSNAKMTLHCNGTKREFLSGKGENLIEVVWIDGKVSYELSHEAHPDVHLARLGRHPLPLNISSILGVVQDVSSHNGSEELQSCLRKALDELPWEPMVVQNDAKMAVSCGGTNLSFVSGEGQTEINVFREPPHGEIHYMVRATGWASFLRFFTRGRIN
ncbi:hypothetical protein JRQ81_003400 [Phrynocephalus forsythii]|uniref:Uncharacterized protein n=1 Tax=Phrynocephalus forsythii TaxID=171643 RepID=A0A9Q0XJR9_9SAUR|nr:hypothetical protein JRQ81_003400 [Phrynocephalus forsythii]